MASGIDQKREVEDLRRYDRLVQAVVGNVCRRLPPHMLRCDLEAAGRLGLLNALRRAQNRDEGFESYAYMLVRYAVQDELRLQDWSRRIDRRRGEAPTVVLDDAPVERHFHSAVDTRRELEIGTDLGAAVGRLPERLRTIIVGHYVEHKRLLVIARELGVSAARITQLRDRALQLLREDLTRQPESTASCGPDASATSPAPLR